MNRYSIIVLSILISAGAQAKPLYLTVPRAFGTGEKPTIDVAFEAKGPVELRVLRPESLDAFVAAQADLRRAYVVPPTYQNPGRGLARGWNGLRAPGNYLLYALGKTFRKEVADAVPQRPSKGPRPLSRVAEGPARLVGTPPGFTLVHSEWLNLDLGGDDREFDVPGFGMWGGESGYQERHVALEKMPAGVYLVQVVQERVEGQVVLVVTDLAVQVKQTDGKVLARVAGRDQAPKQGVTVQSWLPGGGRGPSGRTDAKGEALLAVAEPKILLTASNGKDTALVDTDFYSTLAIASDVFLYSDRPIYKPGDEVRFRGILRKPDGVLSRLFSLRQREVEVELTSQEGRRISTTTEVDEFGSFHGTLSVPKDIGSGVLRISANVDDRLHQGEARAQDYVKPTFYLELTTESEVVQPGGTLRAKVRARRFAGGVPTGARYDVFLYRSQLDSPSWVDDAGMGGQGSAVTYGSQSTTEGKLSVPERLYSSVEKRMQERYSVQDEKLRPDPKDPWKTALPFDANGEASIEVPVPALAEGDDRLPWRYSLTVRAQDDQGTFANGASSLFLSPVEVLGVLRFSAPLVGSGAPLFLSLRSTSLSGKPAADIESKVELILRKPSGEEVKLSEQSLRTNHEGIARLRVLAKEAGTVLARAELKDKRGGLWRGDAQALVAGADGQPIARVPTLTLATLGDSVEPGANAKLIALLPDNWGPAGKDRGPVWVTLSGTTLFSTRLVELSGRTLIHSFNIEKRFGSAVYASIAYVGQGGRWEERTVPFRVLPSQRTLRVQLEPLKSEAAPLADQAVSLRVTDSRGRGVRAQVSIGVVDKAVYAIQSEFRPRVLDFFYPLVRDNVSTFTSAEFQGYGYGEQLARLMAHSARHAFAAVKPPTRQADDKERDTAFWDPAVVTGEDGRATVRFQLPSNQTLWTVTAVAADADGRFGESTAEFATRGELSVYAALPQFLREGDEVMGSVRLSAGGKAVPPLAVSVTGSGAAQGYSGNDRVELAPGGEAIVPVRLIAQKGGNAEVLVEVKGGKDPLRDRRTLAVRAGAVDETLQVSRWGGGELRLLLPEGAVVESAELSLRASTVDAALATVRDLLTYPYGCLEQLIATSVPNIAVAELLRSLGAVEKLDPESQALLIEARSRAVQGVSRVLALAVKGGGFGWYSDREPSLPMTLIALDGLAYAAEAQLVDRSDARLVESARWLEAQSGVPFELDAARAYVLARLEGAAQAPRVRAVLERAEPTGDLYPLALAVLAAEKAGLLQEEPLRTRIALLVQKSRDGFAAPAGYATDTTQAYWRWPVRAVGRMAVIGHAASLGGVDLGSARRKLVELLSEHGLSTFDKSTALLHSLWLIEKDARDFRSLAPVSIESQVQVTLQQRGAGLFADLGNFVGPLKLSDFPGAAVLRAKVRTPLRSVSAHSEGYSLQRRYYALREGGKQALQPGDKVAAGEEVYVELVFDAAVDRHRRSAYSVIEDYVPAGFSPLEEDKAFRAAPHSLPLVPEALKRRVFSPERVTFFLEEPTWWSNHPRTVGYVLRAQFAGRFSAPPATIEDMYAASLRGRTAAATLEVVGR